MLVIQYYHLQLTAQFLKNCKAFYTNYVKPTITALQYKPERTGRNVKITKHINTTGISSLRLGFKPLEKITSLQLLKCQ